MIRPSNRWFAGLLCFLLASFALTIPDVAAHTGERGFVMLLPTQYYLVGGAMAVGISFLILAIVPVTWLLVETEAGHRSHTTANPTSMALHFAAGGAGFLAFLLLVATGLTGNRDPLENLLPLSVWTIWWVGFPLLHALFGNLWASINPWVWPVSLVAKWTPGAELGQRPMLRLPKWTGYWPAVAGFCAFAWFELISLAPADPEILAYAVLTYWLITFTAILLFGEREWLGTAECFSVFFRLLSRLSPVTTWRNRTACNSASDLTILPVSGILFVLLTLATVSFDGFSRTFTWLGWIGINPLEFPGRSAVGGLNTIGLIGMWIVLASAFYGAIWLGTKLCRKSPGVSLTSGTLILSIVPISLGYHFSHYLTALLINGQYTLQAINDPLGYGWDLLLIEPYHVSTSMLNHLESVSVIWKIQAGSVVLGHIWGVAVAHRASLRLHASERDAVFSQIPLALVMVAYTLFGLWLLATPAAG